MSSLEIAELVGSRHDKVKQSVERLVDRGVISQPPMGEVKVQRERRAETVSVYRFEGEQGKRDSYVVVAQLCPEFTARLVDRWQELEGQIAAPRELSRIELLQMALESEQEKISIAAERDEAIRTKAQIGSSREARAMAKASAAVREVVRLKKELERSVKHYTVADVERVLHGLLEKVVPASSKKSQTPGARRTRAWRERKKVAAEIDKQQIGSKREAAAMAKASAATLEVQRLKGELGRHAEHATVIAVERATGKKWPKNTYVALRRWCKRNNAMPVDVIDERYGTVKSWPAGAWLEAYGICLAKLFPVAPL